MDRGAVPICALRLCQENPVDRKAALSEASVLHALDHSHVNRDLASETLATSSVVHWDFVSVFRCVTPAAEGAALYFNALLNLLNLPSRMFKFVNLQCCNVSLLVIKDFLQLLRMSSIQISFSNTFQARQWC